MNAGVRAHIGWTTMKCLYSVEEHRPMHICFASKTRSGRVRVLGVFCAGDSRIKSDLSRLKGRVVSDAFDPYHRGILHAIGQSKHRRAPGDRCVELRKGCLVFGALHQNLYERLWACGG